MFFLLFRKLQIHQKLQILGVHTIFSQFANMVNMTNPEVLDVNRE